ncbi:hypothetical protein HQO42_18895 [Rhodococcus fascians]|nr:hypothetical protein [Rhodococcus fascians]MBY4238686.1 hypothetical protein [Rhodococcus fascians]MBY4254725.1 hypothetical protein [Rhodococcus fascians]MBY4270041.1 hypothetical protein [Rhodococcus fascians]
MSGLKSMTIGELDGMLVDLEERRRTAVRENGPADDLAAVEVDLTRVYNELRRRGL